MTKKLLMLFIPFALSCLRFKKEFKNISLENAPSIYSRNVLLKKRESAIILFSELSSKINKF